MHRYERQHCFAGRETSRMKQQTKVPRPKKGGRAAGRESATGMSRNRNDCDEKRGDTSERNRQRLALQRRWRQREKTNHAPMRARIRASLGTEQRRRMSDTNDTKIRWRKIVAIAAFDSIVSIFSLLSYTIKQKHRFIHTPSRVSSRNRVVAFTAAAPCC